MTAFTSPKTWTGGSPLTATELNVYVRDNVKNLDERIPVIQHKRATGSVMAPGAMDSVTVTWNVAFADTNYTVVAMAHAADTDIGKIICGSYTQAAGSCVIRVWNNSGSTIQPLIYAIAMHD